MDYIADFLGRELSGAIHAMDNDIVSQITEFRIRKNNFFIAIVKYTPFFVNSTGELSECPTPKSIRLTAEYVEKLFLRLCEYSVYANAENIRRGFFTLPNGARVGICGTAVLQNGEISSVKDIASLNIRIPRDVRGCSTAVLNCLYVNSLCSVIVAGVPGGGKTTLLRDMAYQLSGGFNDRYRKVSLIDERGELAGKCGSTYALPVGINTDVLSSYPKVQGIELATRTLSPEMIVCDEIATPQEAAAVRTSFASGVRFALSVHIGSRAELYRKPILRMLLETGEFSYIVLLDGTKYKADILDAEEVLREMDRYDGGVFGVYRSGNSNVPTF